MLEKGTEQERVDSHFLWMLGALQINWAIWFQRSVLWLRTHKSYRPERGGKIILITLTSLPSIFQNIDLAWTSLPAAFPAFCVVCAHQTVLTWALRKLFLKLIYEKKKKNWLCALTCHYFSLLGISVWVVCLEYSFLSSAKLFLFFFSINKNSKICKHEANQTVVGY